MFAEYNYDNFPNIFVTFSESINSEEEFDQFLTEWVTLYNNRRDFSYIFDTRNMKNIPFKYAIKMTLFIKNLRKKPYHYLQKSLILVNDNRIKRLLDFVFTLQSPVAPVYIWQINSGHNNENINNDESNKDNLIDVLNRCSQANLETDMIYIKPNSSLIPFL